MLTLQDGNGFDFCRDMKERHPDTAVIFLTANDMESDMLRGYELGADDYVTKPFPMSVFQKKVAALLTRIKKQSGGDCYNDGNLYVNFSEMAATLNGEAISFTPLEYRLLKVLTKNPQIVLTRQVLLEKLWDIDGNFVDEHALTSTISRIRGKIERTDNPILKRFMAWAICGLGAVANESGKTVRQQSVHWHRRLSIAVVVIHVPAHVFSDKEYACSMLWTTLCCWCFRLYDAFSGLYKAETYLVFRCLM